jgi:hypothetical protein
MLTLTNALSPQATERTYEWASEAGVHHWFNTADTYEWAAKTDVHHWFTADKTTPAAEAGVHHWFNTADGTAPAQLELSVS